MTAFDWIMLAVGFEVAGFLARLKARGRPFRPPAISRSTKQKRFQSLKQASSDGLFGHVHSSALCTKGRKPLPLTPLPLKTLSYTNLP
jgi:hypothetical protein